MPEKAASRVQSRNGFKRRKFNLVSRLKFPRKLVVTNFND